MVAKWSGILSTTEPRNDIGILNVRQGNKNSEIAEFIIYKNNRPYNLTGLKVYLCTNFGKHLVEKPAEVKNAEKGIIQFVFDDDSMQVVGRQKAYFSLTIGGEFVDATQDFEYRIQESILTRQIEGGSFIKKLNDLVLIMESYIINNKNSFDSWFDSIKESLYGIDPGGNLLRELIEARTNSGGSVFKSLKERLFTLDARLDKTIEFKNIKDFGAKGDGLTNDSLAYKNFLKEGGNLLIPDGSYMVDADVYKLISGTNLYFEPKAEINLLPHSTESYSIIQCLDVDDIEVHGARLDGRDVTNISSSGEWGHGIDILNSTNVKIFNPNVKNTWGDGIYVGHNFWGESTKVTDDVSIINPIVDGSRRNGISICGGRNLFIDNPVIKNIRGTNPMAAIDIEPEGMGGVLPLLENLVIRNVTAINCVTGLELMLDNLKDRNLTTDIIVDGIKAIGCDTPITLRKLSGKLDGSVLINKVQSIKSKNGVIFMSGYGATDTPHITIDGMDVDQFNTSISANDYYNHFLTIIALPDEETITDIGNLTILNPNIKETKNTSFKFVFAQLFNTTKKIKNVSIINPKIVTNKEKSNFIRNNPDIKIVDGLSTLKLSGSYYEYFLHQNLATEIDNQFALQLVTYISTDVNMIVGHKVKFRVMHDQPLMFRPSTFIGGHTTVGKGFYSNKIGDVLELTFLGDRWMVDNIIGTWQVEE